MPVATRSTASRRHRGRHGRGGVPPFVAKPRRAIRLAAPITPNSGGAEASSLTACANHFLVTPRCAVSAARKSVVSRKRVSVRVDLVGRRVPPQTNATHIPTHTDHNHH